MLTRDGWTQTWNGENRLIKAEKGTAKLEFAYDYMGRRIFKKVYSGSTLTKHIRFVYNGYKLIEELNALNNNAVLRRYTWSPVGLDTPLSVYDAAANATYYYNTDANKNITELTDATGAVVAHYEYSPFGKVLVANGSYASINPFRFSSEYHDDESSLVYYNYRYYSPELGRWLSRDPIGEKGGWNLYAMVNNSIIDFYDELGLIFAISPPMYAPRPIIIPRPIVIPKPITVPGAAGLTRPITVAPSIEVPADASNTSEAQPSQKEKCPKPKCAPCPPPFKTRIRVDRVPPSRPHHPHRGSHMHIIVYYFVRQNPYPDCKCIYNHVEKTVSLDLIEPFL